MSSKAIFLALCASVLLSTGTTHAASILGSTVLSFSASGSPGSIAGTWSAPALDIAAGDTVEYFLLDIIDFQSSWGTPIGLTFSSYFPGNSRSLDFGTLCPVGISCVGQPHVGAISVVDVATTHQPFALDFLYRLDPDNFEYTHGGSVIVNLSYGESGVRSATALGSVGVTAFGLSHSVAEPSSLAILGAGLAALVTVRRRENRL